jgi:hypothetical protein
MPRRIRRCRVWTAGTRLEGAVADLLSRRVPLKYRRVSTAHAFQTIVYEQVLPRQSRRMPSQSLSTAVLAEDGRPMVLLGPQL